MPVQGQENCKGAGDAHAQGYSARTSVPYTWPYTSAFQGTGTQFWSNKTRLAHDVSTRSDRGLMS